MVKFSYDVAHHRVEFCASDWTGLEYLTVNGKTVSRKFNLAQQSEHLFELSNGDNCKLQLLTDATGAQTICRIYRRDELITSLKHLSSRHMHLGMQFALITCVSCLILMSL
ncbi:hypothetical protein HR45_03535 [Shewanella mangrovi]|uniref:Uncharacterized protein n=1 Tax=Shewanella mangrovi TaxID=1515746 RepID=A0A094LTI3_9GAMM|nr:hypothetical protein [Shewanella mangrovi]KFZ38513.1 hypothetical protein HR45_03535 [Shewanella mangrovi]